GRFTFNEVNARLQVEHPITEMVTGVDLVRQQIRIAAGDGLEVSQAELTRHGHAIECRINAEDPIRNFLPSPGRVIGYREPTGSGVRIDSGVAAGSVVPPYYDPLIAKLIVHTRNRGQAIERMRRSIEAYEIRGVLTNLPFHRELLQRREFVRGDLWTTMVADLRIAARLRSRGPWEARPAADAVDVRIGAKRYRLRIQGNQVILNDQVHRLRIADISEDKGVAVEGRPAGQGAVVDVRSSMPGRVVRVAVGAGTRVHRGQTLVILEAMKMQNEI